MIENTKPNTMKSVRFRRADTSRNMELDRSMYIHMFRQDFQLGILPIGREEVNKLKVNIKSYSKEVKEVEELIKLALPTGNSHPRSFTEYVCGFIKEAVGRIEYSGKAYYEIVYFYANESKSKIDGFKIHPIFRDNINELIGVHWQYVPKNIIGDRQEYSRKLIWLPKNDLFVLTMPKRLGGPRRFRKLLSELHRLGECTVPEFAMKDMEINQQTKGYDFSTYIKNQETYLAKITRRLGWNARGTFSERSLEFYQVYRYLVFEKSKAILREYILDELNRCLTRVGKRMNFRAQITLEGIQSSKDLNDLIKQLLSGKVSFGEVFDLVKK